MPISFGNVKAWCQRGVKLPVLRRLLEVIQWLLVTEAQQPGAAGDWAQRFGKTARSAWKTSWMMLLERSGDRPMISLAAATPMATMAVVLASNVMVDMAGCLKPSNTLFCCT